MAKDEEIDFDDFDEFDDEMSFEEMMGEKSYPEPSTKREAVEQSVTKTTDGFTNAFTDKDISEVADDFIKDGLPGKLKANTDKITDLHSNFKDELKSSIKETKKAGNSLLSTLEGFTSEGSAGRSFIEKARDTLGIHRENEYRQESQEEIINKRVLQDVTDIFGEREDKDKKEELLKEQVAFYRNKKGNELQATNIALLRRNNVFNEKYTANFYRKSLELQFHSLYTNKEILKTAIESANMSKVNLETIVKNTALPDIIKQRSREQLMGMMRDDGLRNLKDTLYSNLDFTSVAKSKLKDKLDNVKDGIIDTLGGVDTMAGSMESMNSMEGMGSKEAQIGGLIAGHVQSKILNKAGDIYGRTKYGKTHIDQLDKVMLDPSEALALKARKSTGIKSVLYSGLADLFKGNDLNNDVKLDVENPDSIAQFDNRTHNTVNTVIPTLLSKIYGGIKSIATGSKFNENDTIKYDYKQGVFLDRDNTINSIKNNAGKSISKSGSFRASNRLIELLKETGMKISVSLQREIASGFLTYVLDGKSLHPDNLFRSGLFSKQYFRPATAKVVRKLVKNYLYNGDSNQQLINRKAMYGTLKDMKTELPSAKKLLHDSIKAGNINELRSIGLVKKDNEGNNVIDVDNYKKFAISSIKDNFEYDKVEDDVDKKESEFTKIAEEQKRKLEEKKAKLKKRAESSMIGGFIMDKIDKINNFDGVVAVETVVDGVIAGGKKGIKKAKDIKDGKYTKDDVVTDLTKVKGEIELNLSKESLEKKKEAIEVKVVELEQTIKDKKKEYKEKYDTIINGSPKVQKAMKLLTKGGVNTLQVINDIKDGKYSKEDVLVLKDNLASVLTKEELDKFVVNGNVIASNVKKSIENSIPDNVKVSIEEKKKRVNEKYDIHAKSKVDNILEELSKGKIQTLQVVNDIKEGKYSKEDILTLRDRLSTSLSKDELNKLIPVAKDTITNIKETISTKVKEHIPDDTIDVITEYKDNVVTSVAESTLYKTSKAKVDNIKSTESYKTIEETLKEKYKDVKDISIKDIEHVSVAISKTIAKGGDVVSINNILNKTLEIKSNIHKTDIKAKEVSKEITDDIDDEKTLLNLGKFGKLVKLTSKDSILRKLLTKNIFQLMNSVRKKVTGKEFNHVPSTLEALMMPYKYAGKGVGKVGKFGLETVGKTGMGILNNIGDMSGIKFRKGVSDIGSVYKGAGTGALHIAGKGLSATSDIGKGILSKVGNVAGIGYRANKVKDAYGTIGKGGKKILDPTVSAISKLGTNIVSSMGKLINVDYKEANTNLAKDIATEVDKKNDENRNEGKVRKGSWRTMLYGKKHKSDLSNVLPTVKDLKKSTPTMSILSILMGMGSLVSGIYKGVTSSLGFLGSIAGGIAGMLGLSSLLGKGGKLTSKVATKLGTKILSKTSTKMTAKSVAKGTTKFGVKALGKSILKKIPGLSILAGLGFGISRLFDGDVKGAMGEVASGVMGTIPGIGAAGSVAMDAYLAKRDYDNSKPESATMNTSHVKDAKLKPANNKHYGTNSGNGESKIMDYLGHAEGTKIHKNRTESDITLPYGIYRKSWKNTELEKYLTKLAPSGNLRRDKRAVNNIIKSDPVIKEDVKHLAFKFYEKHFMNKRLNSVLNKDEQLILFSNSVNGGKARGVKSLQSAVSHKLTGKVTNSIFTAIGKARAKGVDIARGMLGYMRRFYAGLIRRNPAKYKLYKKGWNNRLNTLEGKITSNGKFAHTGKITGSIAGSVNNRRGQHKVANNIEHTPRRRKHTVANNVEHTPIVHNGVKNSVSVNRTEHQVKTPIKVPTTSNKNNTTKVHTNDNIIDKETLEGHSEICDRLDKQIHLQTAMLEVLNKIHTKQHVKGEDKPVETKIVDKPKNKKLPPPVINLNRENYGT